MTPDEFRQTLTQSNPPTLSPPLLALWYDLKNDWTRAHDLINDLETPDAMAVHAYLHRKHGDLSNADYWYARCGRQYFRPAHDDERQALLAALLA